MKVEPPLFGTVDEHPIGIEPEWLWREHRIQELSQAIDRQCAKVKAARNYDLIVSWSQEMTAHALWLLKEKK